ncbi:MAG TPA: hypothetical protein VH120_20860 [Gemmataceae bacterium]|jgi:hypothetical protein|nr:hypothetical protein [Gemmataceae bacterium]
MTDYQLSAPTRRCHLTGREFRPGERYMAALVEEAGRFVRRDFAPDVWSGPPENAIGHWAARIPVAGETPKRPPIDGDLLAECFDRLDGATEPNQVQFRYVVALLLMRRKRFQFEDVHKDPAGETLLLRDTRSGERHLVADPKLTEEAMAAVQDEVFRVLGWA